MGKDDLPPLGGKPTNKDKGINPLKKKTAQARENPIMEEQMQPQDPLGEFGDVTVLSKDWRLVPMIIGIVLKQKFDICWAIALTRFLQAIYNISNTASYKEFLHDDLVVHLKLKNKSDTRTSLKLQNLKDAINHIAVKGLLKIKASGFTKAGSETGYHGKWQFLTEKCPSASFIKSKVDISPVVISFEIVYDFHFIGKSIYNVSGVELEDGEVEGHALLIVGYGYTKDRKLFFLTQNSWGEAWGVKGFGRIFIDENSKTTLVYPQV